MKKIIILLILCLLSPYIRAQDNINISFLRTGIDLETLSEKIADLFEITKEKNDFPPFLNTKSVFYIDYEKKFVNGYRIFKSENFIINDLIFKNVEIIFHNNKLISFQSDYLMRIEEILTYKYKKPKIDKMEDSVQCIYKITGNKITYNTYSYQYEWVIGGDKAILLNRSYYNNSCEKKYIGSFTLINVKEQEIYINEVNKMANLLILQLEDDKKKNMEKY